MGALLPVVALVPLPVPTVIPTPLAPSGSSGAGAAALPLATILSLIVQYIPVVAAVIGTLVVGRYHASQDARDTERKNATAQKETIEALEKRLVVVRDERDEARAQRDAAHERIDKLERRVEDLEQRLIAAIGGRLTGGS